MSVPEAARGRLLASQSYCRRVTRDARSNLTVAFLLLPRRQRDAMRALYAFMRLTDDLADEGGEAEAKAARLDDWRAMLEDGLAGRYRHPVFPALHTAIGRFGVPAQYLFDVIDGVGDDLERPNIGTFPELYAYCYRVASAVGLACVHIWGFRGDALPSAEAAGVAFQLTNILRDLGEDRAAGRVYLPADELARFAAPPGEWSPESPAFQRLARFQAERARQFYALGDGLTPRLSREGRAIFGVMAGTYRRLLDCIEARDFDVFQTRVRVPRREKLRLLARALPIRWGAKTWAG